MLADRIVKIKILYKILLFKGYLMHFTAGDLKAWRQFKKVSLSKKTKTLKKY